jgi:hypothetical protein
MILQFLRSLQNSNFKESLDLSIVLLLILLELQLLKRSDIVIESKSKKSDLQRLLLSKENKKRLLLSVLYLEVLLMLRWKISKEHLSLEYLLTSKFFTQMSTLMGPVPLSPIWLTRSKTYLIDKRV